MSAESTTTRSDQARERAQQDLAATIAAHTAEEYEARQKQALAAAIAERDGTKPDHSAPNIAESDICTLHGGGPAATGKKARSSSKPALAATPAATKTYMQTRHASPGRVDDLELHRIHPSPFNPRQHYDEDALRELGESIKTHGLLEPVVVRYLPADQPGYNGVYLETRHFQILAGERRYRAAKLVGLKTLDCRIMHDVDDKTALEMCVMENLQRADLDPVEEARGFAALRDAGLNQTEIAAAVHKSQPVIAKALGLLKMPADVQELVRTGKLSPAHVDGLLRFKEFPAYVSAAAAAAIEHGWTSKQLAADKLPRSWDMTQPGGPLRDLDQWHRKFDIAICKQCPFNAYRSSGAESGHCLNPTHFDELQAFAVAEERAKQNQELAKVAEQLGRAPADLPRLEDMTWDQYQTIDVYNKPPAGCSEACSCRTKAINRQGDVVVICENKKRFQELKAKEEVAKKEARRQAAEAVIAAISQTVAARERITIHELVMVLAPVLKGAGKKAVAAAAKRQLKGIKLPELEQLTRDDLLVLDELTIVRLAVDALATYEQLEQMGDYTYVKPDASAWYATKFGLTSKPATQKDEVPT